MIIEIVFELQEGYLIKVGNTKEECQTSAAFFIPMRRDIYTSLHASRHLLDEHLSSFTPATTIFFHYPNGHIPVTEL